ncbi:Os04g0196300 [Oryza sativa Japonica Group]|uniref:Os04g0196300 protein n=2 Tax=Oryza sativa subsp. japonica TaxID=39947 RepID=B7ELP5_ORYSJ|nr:unnamed protein product [Oryza sativa Japonica Group]BAS88050.1 Os04g0196300 [Oryza sativa Japonica Group]
MARRGGRRRYAVGGRRWGGRRLPSVPPSQIWPEGGGGRRPVASVSGWMAGGRQRLPSLPPSQIWPESGGGRLVAGQRPGGRRRRRLPAVTANSLPTCLSPRP